MYACVAPYFQVFMLQPAIFSAAALHTLAPAIVDGDALTKTCAAFGVTHDVALGFLAWMHGLRWQVRPTPASPHTGMGAQTHNTHALCSVSNVLSLSLSLFPAFGF